MTFLPNKSILITLIFVFTFSLTLPSRAAIQLPPDAHPCIQWASQDLKTHHIVKVKLVDKKIIPTEAFQINIQGNDITIQASDPTGMMYGLFELKYQIKHSALQSTVQKPYTQFRADNPFIHVNPISIKDVKMWKSYIDQLARNRFNFLDFHGGYDLDTTQFPNLYPLLVHVPEYKKVGNKTDQRENLNAFKEITAHAKNRCIKVGLMNYSTKVAGLKTRALEDYTAKAIAILLKELPALNLIGFRVGETGNGPNFFKNAYLKGIKDSNRTDIKLYTRSWKTTKNKLEKIGQEYGGKFLIELKYNGEHLGLPYQAIHEGGGSYSYQDYLSKPRPYDVIWQVRANGTHRFWAWANVAFIKRAVQSFHFGEAVGYTLEPHIAYFPLKASTYFKNKEEQDVYDYIWQKHWMWYFLWGHLSYNPNMPDQQIISAFTDHFGEKGKLIYQAMQESGKIIPLIMAYRYQGPDHRNFSPETETGNFWLTNKWDTHSFKPAWGFPNLLSFSKNRPMDERSFIGIENFVLNKINTITDGRITPLQVANILEKAANKTDQLVQKIRSPISQAPKEWDLLKTDLLATRDLARYYTNRIYGAIHLNYAVKTDSKPDFEKALKYFEKSRLDWKQLAQTADAIYAPLKNRLRINGPLPSDAESSYQWSSQSLRLEQLDQTAPQVWKERFPDFKKSPLKFSEIDKSIIKGLRVINTSHKKMDPNSIKINCTLESTNGVKNVILWHKPTPSENKWRETKMKQMGETSYSVTIPLTKKGLLYQIEVKDKIGQAILYPDVLQQTPYIPVLLNSADDRKK